MCTRACGAAGRTGPGRPDHLRAIRVPFELVIRAIRVPFELVIRAIRVMRVPVQARDPRDPRDPRPVQARDPRDPRPRSSS
jgi:hypothetical protein